MKMIKMKKKRRSYLLSVLSCHCPRCREGKLFQYPFNLKLKKNLLMNKTCPVCGQPTQLEVGFYYGTGYVSYALTVLISILSFVLWLLTIGMSLHDNRFFFWLGGNAVFLILIQPWLMRISRSIWISWFVKYDPNWEENKLDESEKIVTKEIG